MDLLTTRERQQLDEEGCLPLTRLVEPKRVKMMRLRLEELLAGTKQEHAGTLVVGGYSMRKYSTPRGCIRASWRRRSMCSAAKAGSRESGHAGFGRGTANRRSTSTGEVRVCPACGIPVTRSALWSTLRATTARPALCLGRIATLGC